jgi:hypothetical protein
VSTRDGHRRRCQELAHSGLPSVAGQPEQHPGGGDARGGSQVDVAIELAEAIEGPELQPPTKQQIANTRPQVLAAIDQGTDRERKSGCRSPARKVTIRGGTIMTDDGMSFVQRLNALMRELEEMKDRAGGLGEQHPRRGEGRMAGPQASAAR